jgi:cytochrome P450
MTPAASLLPLLQVAGRSDPAPYYAELHRLGQAAALGPDDKHAAVVFGYEAVGQVLRDPVFRVLDAAFLDRSGTGWRRHAVLRVMQRSVFNAPPEAHARMRRPFSQALNARRVARNEPAIELSARRHLDRLARLGADGEPVDFAAEFAVPLPAEVIGTILGVAEADRRRFPDLVRTFDAVLELGQPDFRDLLAANRAALELTAFFTALLADRRAQPRDDLVSALVRELAETGDEASAEAVDELIANLIVFFNAGFRTTANLIGNGLLLLLAHPQAAEALRADPALAPAYVEEILRVEPPVHFAVRYAAEDTEAAGVPVPAGRTVLVLTAAANRDPKRFPDPDRFDPTRGDDQHYAFSAGPHYCLGAILGRTEGRIILPLLLERFPDLALAAAPEPLHNLMLRGPVHLPVRLAGAQ